MAFSQEEHDRIIGLIKSIENRRPHTYAALTYRDGEELAEMSAIIAAHDECDAVTLAECANYLRRTAEYYRLMNRSGIADGIYLRLLRVHKLMSIVDPGYYKIKNNSRARYSDVRSALKLRCSYCDEECEDIYEIVQIFLEQEEFDKLLAEVIGERLLKMDPVELSEEYLAVIDEVEKKAEEMKKTDLFAEQWRIKQELLAGYGIKWKTLSEMNPDMKFD